MLSALTGLTELSVVRNRPLFGRVLESYVYAELLKQATWAEQDYTVHTYRDKDQVDVDFVIENIAGQVTGVEVKTAASVSANDLIGLKKLSLLAGEKFVAGIVLYDGKDTLPIGRQLWAVPISTLWGA